MEDDAPVRLVELRVDGGATRNNMLMQFQADLLGVPVARSRIQETTALGAAYLAGLAVGYWKTAADIDGQWQAERTFEPKMSRDQANALRAGWDKAVGRSRGWANPGA
jgi:glycerol kinase